MHSTKVELFPTPTLSPARDGPKLLPGSTPESTETLKAVLKENHVKYHAFFDEAGFHNHLSHRAIAVWAVGASSDVIRSTFEIDSKIQRPRSTSPEKITPANFKEHLGDPKYYDAYVVYFVDRLQTKSAADILEEHVFTPAMNFHDENGTQPQMLSRFVDSIVHPMIHTGYGFQFGIPGMVAEGLGQTAIHQTTSAQVVPRSLFSKDLVDGIQAVDMSKDAAPLHAFSVLARIMKDDTIHFSTKPADYFEGFAYAMENFSDTILELVAKWAQFDASDAKVLEQKVAEVVWTNALLYGVSGYGYRNAGEVNGSFNADFYVMHIVTSSIFLPTLVSELKPASAKLLLRAYFAVVLASWIAQGKPKLDLADFFSGPIPAFDPSSDSSPANSTGNPWFTIIDYAIEHPDDHLVKNQRALAHYASLYGSKKAGDEVFSGTELEGADKIDGTLFLRAAALTAIRAVELQPALDNKQAEGDVFWDRPGYFN